MTSASKLCILTGATGLVGSQLRSRLVQQGWNVEGWSRHPDPAQGDAEFHLGQEISPERFGDAQALVHCAYDFTGKNWSQIAASNVWGSKELFQSAHTAGVRSIVLLSSLSAFEGCRSLYGKAKLEIEKAGNVVGACILRSGLVWGGGQGGLFSALARLALRRRVIPVLSGCPQSQYLLHIDDLAEVVIACLEGRIPLDSRALNVASSHPWSLKQLINAIAAQAGRRPLFLPIPWQIAWLALKTAEAARVKTTFRSDSLLSLVYQDPQPSFQLLTSLGFRPRAFDPKLISLNPANPVTPFSQVRCL